MQYVQQVIRTPCTTRSGWGSVIFLNGSRTSAAKKMEENKSCSWAWQNSILDSIYSFPCIYHKRKRSCDELKDIMCMSSMSCSSTPSTDLLLFCVLWGHWPEDQRSTTNNPHCVATSFQLIETVINVVSSQCPCRCPYSVLQTVSSLPAAVFVLSGFYLESLHHSIKGSHAFVELLDLSVWGHLPAFCSTDLQLVRHVGNVDAL